MSKDLLQFDDFVLNRGAYELRRGDVVVPLQRIPLELPCLLVERRGQLVTRAEILERVWGKGSSLRRHVCHPPCADTNAPSCRLHDISSTNAAITMSLNGFRR